ncbi:MAG: hypothetical protein LAT76_10830 [Schleiferiaceae bacterium]|jgi:hypothetical protein|nr:hypothetical protein [Schleiferiaceae bacterium]
MLIKGVDLERELVREQQKRLAKEPDEVLNAFKKLLADDDKHDEQILKAIFTATDEVENDLEYSKLNPALIFDIQDIKNICIHYRLRFLPGGLFKGEIPQEALTKIKQLERKHGVDLAGFKIVAPAAMFNLKEKDKDPLLLAPLGNDKYYLIHKWGTDLHPLRKILVYPFRNFVSLLRTVAGVAFFIAAIIPSSVMMGPHDTTSLHIRVILFFYLFLAFSGMTALYGFSRMRNFNAALWKSQYTD